MGAPTEVRVDWTALCLAGPSDAEGLACAVRSVSMNRATFDRSVGRPGESRWVRFALGGSVFLELDGYLRRYGTEFAFGSINELATGILREVLADGFRSANGAN